MATAAELQYVSVGCNRVPQALCWGKNNLVAFAGCNSVFIYKPNITSCDGGILHVLNGHTARVNCVQWLESQTHNTESSNELISASTDKNIIIWKYTDEKWDRQSTLSAHKEAVTSLCSLKYEHDDQSISIIVSVSTDSTLHVWFRQSDEEEFSSTQQLCFNGLVHSLALSKFSTSSDVILACGCDNTMVKLYLFNHSDHQFSCTLNLSGHEDWIRCVKFHLLNDKEMLLASSSQDTYIRIWKLSIENNVVSKNQNEELQLEQQSFPCSNEKKIVVVLESVLIGHEGWVLGLSWNKTENSKVPSLLSASMDRTMIIWRYDEELCAWIDKARMGNVGGNALGYYGCTFSPSGDAVLGHDYQAAFHLWKLTSEGEESWESLASISGHFGSVEDFDWDPCGGEFAVTLSTDQTTRLYAPWKKPEGKITWHEIARPQIHGHDLKCLAMLGRYKFASGAQEKVVRVFGAPKSFYQTFCEISGVADKENELEAIPVGATVPVLGLSNKAVFEDDIKSWENDTANSSSQPMKASAFASEDPPPFNPSLITEPPVDDILSSSTLWPELQKLYGHGYEIFTMAATCDGHLLATASKASKQEHAGIILWDMQTCKEIQRLLSHSLTVTQLAFSSSGKYLLSVSRDRTWSLFMKSHGDNVNFILISKTDKKTSIHTRIIWACSWFPCEQHFVTASRDKKIIVWGAHEHQWCAVGDAFDIGESATAVSVSNKQTQSKKYIIAVGLESGGIHLYTWIDSSFCLIYNVPKTLTPSLTIKRVRWRVKREDPGEWQLGICSADHTFRIISFKNELFS